MAGARTVVIFNPSADRGRCARCLPAIKARLAQDRTAEWSATSGPGDAERAARRAGEVGAGTVVALGGDGTVHEIVNGLLAVEAARRPRLAVIPLGTGNDFAFGLSLPTRLEAAIEIAFGAPRGPARRIDAAVMSDNLGRRRFWANSISVGLGAAVTIESHRIHRLHGLARYVVAAVRTIARGYEAPRMSICCDCGMRESVAACGTLKPCLRVQARTNTLKQGLRVPHLPEPLNPEQWAGRVLMLTLGNGPREGGCFKSTPQARMDDGSLDYMLAEPMSRMRTLRLVPEVVRGRHARFAGIRLGRFRALRLVADRNIPIHADGEVFADETAGVRELAVDILPGALEVVC